MRARTVALVAVPVLLCAALAGAAVQAQWQMYDIGHKRDAKTKLVGIKDFNTPLLGKAKIAQFNVESGLGAGAWVVGAAVLLQLTAAWAGCERSGVLARGKSVCRSDARAALSLKTIPQES